MADETPVTPAAPPIPDSIPIDTDPSAAPSTIHIDLNPEYDPAKDTRPGFQKINLHPTGPTIEAAPDPTLLERAKKVFTEGIPQLSSRTVNNPKYGQEQFLTPEEALTPKEQRAAPVATGELEAAGGLTSPAAIGTMAATAGLGETPAIVSKVASGLFAGLIAASVYDQYPALKTQIDKAQSAKTQDERADAFTESQRLLTHMGVDTVMGLLAGVHGVEGAKDILNSTTGSGVPDEASTFKAPKGPAAPEPEETHPEMNRKTVKDLQDLGYSNQHITNFNISEIRDILKNQTPAAEHPVSKPAAPVTAPEPDKFAEVGGKLVGSQPAEAVEKPVSPVENTTEATDPVEDLIMSDKIGGKKVRGATPKVDPLVVAQQATPRGLVERTTGDPEVDTAIKTAGAIPAGNMAGLALFHDPKTSSTLALKTEDVTPEAVQQHLAASRKSYGLTPESDALAEAGGKFVGEQPAIAPAIKNPISQIMASPKGFGTTTDPLKAGFILSDGRMVPLQPGAEHNDMIALAGGESLARSKEDIARAESKGLTREQIIENEGTIRTRYRMSRAGNEVVFSVPSSGVSSEQIDQMKKSVAAIGRNGNAVIEVGDPILAATHNTTKEFVRPSDVEDMLKEIGAHPDQQVSIDKELQNPHKQTYGMEVTDSDGNSQKVKIDAHSSKQALATVVKKFPEASEWRLDTMPEEKAPSTDYSIPTGKIQKMKASTNRPEIHTIRHELGHVFIGKKFGMTQEGMLSSSHPGMPADARAGVAWSTTGRFAGGKLKPEALVATVHAGLGGIAADEVFNDLGRNLNQNFDMSDPTGDGGRAYRYLTAEGMSHDEAMDFIHRAIDANVEYLKHPVVSAMMHENAGVREEGLSKQFHFSPERLDSIVAETNRRIADEKDTKKHDNGSVDGRSNQDSAAAHARGEGEGAGNAPGEPSEAEEGIIDEDKVKKTKAPKEVTPELAQQIVDAHEAAGGSTFNLMHGNLAGTDNYAVSAHPERGQVLDHSPTTQDIQNFAAKNQDLLKNPEKSLGTWADPNGSHALDVVATLPDREKAIALGIKNNQKAIYHLGGEGEIQTGGTGEVPVSDHTVSTRMPTGKVKGKVVEDHTDQSRMSDMDAAKAAPGYVQKMVNRTNETPGFVAPEGTAQEQADAYIRHVADNIKFVHSKIPPEEFKRDEKWYPVGAHERGIAVAEQHGFTPHQVYAVTSVESPMTDWDQNTSLAERTVNIWKNQQNTKFTPEMQKAADKITSLPANKAFKPYYKKLAGKTLAELPDTRLQAHWLRLYDEAHNPRDYETWGPDGKSLGLAKNMDGSNKKVGWSFQSHIEKAIEILKDGSDENISKNLGKGHKVRNFYNNQVAPDDPRFLTMDTHAINVAQLRPMSGKTKAVRENFGGITNGKYGLKGTYPIHDAGYRLAAKELDIPIPGRLQSPTWVKIRDVFTDDFKTPENQAAVDAIWKEHENGKITADEARNQVWDYATRWNRENAGGTGAPADQGKLFEGRVHGQPASGASGRGTGVGTAREVPAPGVDEDTSFDFGANVKLAPSRVNKVSDKQRAKNDAMVAGLINLSKPGKK